MRPLIRNVVALAVALLAGLPAAAVAQQVDGNPLDVHADGLGRIQARFDGQQAGLFFPPETDSANAGLEIKQGDVHYALGTERTPVSGPIVGRPGPGRHTLRSVYRVGPDLEVTERLSYADGDAKFDVRYVIRNVSDAAVSFRAGALADLYAAGDDSGTGLLRAGPPRLIGGRAANGVVLGLLEGTPWSGYQAGEYSGIFAAFADTGLTGAVDGALTDNGAGAEWDVSGLAPGAAYTIDAAWRSDPPAVTDTVTTTKDRDDGACDADCSLREALAHAGAGAVVVVPPGTYRLDAADTLGGVTVAGPLTLRGAGARETRIDGAGAARALTVADGGRLGLSGVTVSGGASDGDGGGIGVEAGGALSLADSAVTENSAARGGGIASAGSLSVVRSTVAGNTASAAGGGIFAAGTGAELSNSTVSGNEAQGAGGGIAASAPLRLLHVTVAANRAGAEQAGGVAVLEGASVNARSALVAANAGQECKGAFDVDSAHDVSEDATCGFRAPTDRQGADAKLGPLADNGGATDTHDLLWGSAALDAGAEEGCPPVDQRGVARPLGATCDAGAVEGDPAAPPPPPDPTPQPTPAPTAEPTPQPTPQPTPTPTPTEELPPPRAGKTVNAAPARGTVKVRRPGDKGFTELEEGAQVPVGTLFDTTKGRLTLTAAGGSEATFYAGIFKVAQGQGARPLTTLELAGPAPACATKARKSGGPRAAASAKRKRRKKRRLWGDGTGRFRTTGDHSSATVRGTRWLVEDSCAGTLTRVARGEVEVRDFTRKASVVVKAGGRYLARPARGKKR